MNNDRKTLKEIKARIEDGYQGFDTVFEERVSRQRDIDWLLDLATRVVETAGLGMDADPTVFDLHETEFGFPNLEEMFDNSAVQVGQSMDAILGYYTKPEKYTRVSVDEDGNLCGFCLGDGCGVCRETGLKDIWKWRDIVRYRDDLKAKKEDESAEEPDDQEVEAKP